MRVVIFIISHTIIRQEVQVKEHSAGGTTSRSNGERWDGHPTDGSR